jgi:hypothetical protein
VKSGELLLLELDERGRLGLLVLGEDDPLDQRQPVAEELVLGAAQADALGAVGAAARASSGVSALARMPSVRRSSAHSSSRSSRGSLSSRPDRAAPRR